MASPFFPRMQRVASGLRAGHDRRGRYSGMGATGGVIDSCPIAYGGGEGIFKYIEGLPLSFSGHRSATAEELMSTDTREQEITWLARSCSSSGSDPNKKKSEHQSPKVNLGEKIMALQQIMSPFGKTDTASVLLETITYIKFLHGTDAGAESTAFLDGGSIEEAPCISARLPSWERSGGMDTSVKKGGVRTREQGMQIGKHHSAN
ncbi:Os12g0180800 [Oryza sativa Japonica Group]|uniref:Os12g0180800 protein n=1 Tax=Oryza sativa subsp. japonica TaxID=39947 RepID=A0A0P0Y7U7_ORYSJ|nr:Os12g0180800 [Oryza sativa Japonica Group]